MLLLRVQLGQVKLDDMIDIRFSPSFILLIADLFLV